MENNIRNTNCYLSIKVKFIVNSISENNFIFIFFIVVSSKDNFGILLFTASHEL
ncbi:uncharacterized protein METZ01_LOCUS432719 [marine metagenome]|uniref:Uncharacterized protein n=1 Tax=marine metagenome TaxID=408172 RepID=A0A382YAJ5_9ZZZZ